MPDHSEEAWTKIRVGLEKILDATEMLTGFELSDEEQSEQCDAIKAAVREVRHAAHDCIYIKKLGEGQ